MGQKGLDLKDGNLISYALFPLTIAAFIAVLIAVHARGTIAVYGLAYAIIHQLQAQLNTRPKKLAVRTRWLVRQLSSLTAKSNAWCEQ
jgi:type IV secretory pathway VirB6-like protein